MAFNPFETFSVRSKVGRSVMAILGIVVMLTFVLSSGAVGTGNDFFDQVGSLFSSRGQNEVVAVAYGDNIRVSELSETRRERMAAQEFLRQASLAANTAWAKDLDGDLKSSRLTADFKKDIERFITLRVNLDKDMRAYQAFLEDFFRFGQESQRLSMALNKARQKPDSEDRKVADAIAALILNDMAPTPLFMAEIGFESDRDLLDFILLKKKADQLGLMYSAKGVRELIKQDTAGRLSTQTEKEIERRMLESGRFGAMTSDWLDTALANEYRARAAMTAMEGESPFRAEIRRQRTQGLPALLLLGQDAASVSLPGGIQTLSAMPGVMTPYEFFEFYKDRCSEHTFAVIEVKAESFLDKVPGEPTMKERNELFNKHRGELPDPSRDRPGFKEPKKVKVEFVALDATSKRITDAIPKVQAAEMFLCASAGAIAGNPAVALTTAAQPAIAEGLPVKELVAEKMDKNLSRYTALEQYMFEPRDVSVYRPQPLAALLAGFAGYPSPTAAVAPIALMFRQVEAHDVKTRVPFLLQAWLTPFNPTMANALGMPAFAYGLNPKLPPEGLYVADARKEVAKRQRQTLFEEDFKRLREKLRELTDGDSNPFAPKPEKATLEKNQEQAKKYLADWMKERGLTPVATPEPVDAYSVVTAPALKPLNDLAAVEPDGTNSLSKRLFAEDDPRTRMPTSDASPFKPFWFPGEPAGDALDKPNQLVWITEEIEPKAYNSLDNANRQTNGDMTRRVDRAWRLEKARVLAKAEAERLAEKAKVIGQGAAKDRIGVEQQLRDLAAPDHLRMFDLDRLAKLKFEHGATQARQGYEESKIDKALVPYPTPFFVDQLLELRKQQVGGVVVLGDAPRLRYYVATEVSRFEKTVEQFRDVFVKSNSTGAALNPLYERFALPEERGEALMAVRARLRADAKLEEKEAFRDRDKRDSE